MSRTPSFRADRQGLRAVAVLYNRQLLTSGFIGVDMFFVISGFLITSWFVSNQYFAGFGDYFVPKSDELPLLHIWSLTIEIQFYLFYSFLILLLKAERLKLIVPAIIVSLLAGYHLPVKRRLITRYLLWIVC